MIGNYRFCNPERYRCKLTRRPHHDDVIKWRHFPRYWPFVWGIHRSPVNSPHKGQWHGALMFPLICVWINGWVNNREAGDLRSCHAHYDVTVMQCTGYRLSRVKSTAVYKNIMLRNNWRRYFIKCHWRRIYMINEAIISCAGMCPSVDIKRYTDIGNGLFVLLRKCS